MRTRPDDTHETKPLRFLNAAHDDIMKLPEEVRSDLGFGLFLVQRGEMPDNASPFEGSTGGNIMKLVERHNTDTYRCVFTAKFELAVYVLHVFKKKSSSGISTPQREIETVQARYKRAQELYQEEFGSAPLSPPGGKKERP